MPTIQDSVNTKSFLPHNKNIVTFRDLQKVLQSKPDYYSSQQSEMLDRLRGKPLWVWNHGRHDGYMRIMPKDCALAQLASVKYRISNNKLARGWRCCRRH